MPPWPVPSSRPGVGGVQISASRRRAEIWAARKPQLVSRGVARSTPLANLRERRMGELGFHVAELRQLVKSQIPAFTKNGSRWADSRFPQHFACFLHLRRATSQLHARTYRLERPTATTHPSVTLEKESHRTYCGDEAWLIQLRMYLVPGVYYPPRPLVSQESQLRPPVAAAATIVFYA